MSASPPLLNPLPPTTYGTKVDEHLLEQYKLYVDSSQKLSDRRVSTNNYLLTINSTLLTLIGLLYSLLTNRKPLIMIPIAGFFLSLAWSLLIASFKRLNGAKFDVIHQLEDHLPANVFKEEWRQLKSGLQGKYRPMSDLERLIPWLFILLYFGLGLFIWTWSEPKEDKVQKIQIESPVRVDVNNTTNSK
jgi:hypothetical protein